MRIHNKLFIAWLSASFVLILVMVFAMQWSVDRGMLQYINTREANELQPAIEDLAQHFSEQGNWDYFAGRGYVLNEFVRSRRENTGAEGPRDGRRRDQGMPPHERRGPGPERGSERSPERGPERGAERGPRQGPEMGPGRGPGSGPGMRPRNGEHRPHGGEGRPPPPYRSDGRLQPGERDGRPGPGGRRPPPPGSGHSLYDAERNVIVGNPDSGEQRLLPITVDGSTVGWLGMLERREISEDYDLALVEQLQTMLLIVGAVMVAVAIAFTRPMARHLVAPLQVIAAAVHRLSQGDYRVKLPPRGDDEISRLASDVNRLAVTLEDSEQQRKRWLADTSHELRTPLAVLKGEIEAMLDGVRPSGSEQIQSLHQEISHLQRLIDDLYELSAADIGGLRYQFEAVELDEILDDVVDSHRSLLRSQDLDIDMDCEQEICLQADPGRLIQLLENLLGNSRKYTDPGGRVQLSGRRRGMLVEICVEDSAPGVPDEALGHLFDHLFRVDSSRNRATGGSGLGLALAQRIVEAHHGTIKASHSSLGGVKITVLLPAGQPNAEDATP